MSQSQRKDQIARIAAQLFAKRGFAGTAVKTIADRARVSEAMIFKLFRSKDGLYRYIIENRELTALRERFYAKLQALAESNDDEGIFRAIADTIFDFHLKDATLIRLTLYSALEGHATALNAMQGRADLFFSRLTAYVESRATAGVFEDIDPQVVVRAFIGMLGYFILLRQVFKETGTQDLDPDHVAQTFTDIFLNGIRKR
ncbi:MAG: TetR/AcrR family transcriptional regulator [Planctomycetes bacterium]|nr:TetR/AcrR family transcriptional regulator [Planctomycetota bacterium]